MDSSQINPSAQNSTPPAPSDRCRLVLVMDGDSVAACTADQLQHILASGDVASIIFSPITSKTTDTSSGPLDEHTFQSLIEPLVSVAQASDVATIVAEYSRVAGRVGADGLQLGQDPDALREAIAKFTPAMMVGAANVKTRHNALVLGELQPDYVMFGNPGGDIRPQAHPRNIALGEWWASMVEIPSIVLGGNDPDSALDIANSGVEFVALGAAIFKTNDVATSMEDAAKRVQYVNKLLDDNAPRFQEPEN